MNDLRETFHRWVRTLALPVRDGGIGVPLAHVPARIRRDAPEVDDPDERERAGETIEEVSAGLRVWLRTYKDELTERLAAQLRFDGEAARRRSLWPWRFGCRNNAREAEFLPSRRRDGRQLATPIHLRAVCHHDSFYS